MIGPAISFFLEKNKRNSNFFKNSYLSNGYTYSNQIWTGNRQYQVVSIFEVSS